ncbi:MAG: hypothetical protein CMI52_04555, partial [Parcubacteria group bacterium]|nr:hypothetical protein [Parcubacteria group bacterium]
VVANRHDLLFAFEQYRNQATAPEAMARDEVVFVESVVEEIEEVKEIEGEKSTSTPELPKSEDKDVIPAEAGTQLQAKPAEFNLAIPFTSQAPHGNWEMPYQEACEEASILMSSWFINDIKSRTKGEADQEILELVAWQEERFGYYKDTTVEETLSIVHEYFGYADAYIIENPSIKDITDAVAFGYPVIVPAAGKLLNNPYFTGDGPLYHMLVIRGYAEDEFITNDPGTRRGEQFRYKQQHIMDVMHDWNGGDVINGKKAVIIVKNEV